MRRRDLSLLIRVVDAIEWLRIDRRERGCSDDMRSRPRALLVALALAVLFAGAACTTSEPDAEVAPRELVRLSGSGTCIPMLRLLTDAYDSDEAEWRYLPGLHTGGGIQGVASGGLEIGAASRDLTDDELALGLQYTPLADDGLVIAVHPSVILDGLTTQQVRDIYAGAYSNWSELGGPDLPITILDRNEDESAKIIMREYVLGQDLVISDKAVSLYYEPDMIEGVQSTAGAIGYFSLGYSISTDVPVTHVALDGVEPTVDNIGSGSYRVVRPLGVVTAPDASAEVKAFLAWAASDDAREMLQANGYAPVR